MERVVFARHGESEFSARGTVNGDPLCAGGALTGRGREEARALGMLLADEPIDLCVTTEFRRTLETADIALAGRDVPRIVLPQLNDIRFGRFEGGSLEEYRTWAHANSSATEPPGGGECRQAIARRYVDGFRTLLERPERTILVVAHALPIAYVLMALEGRDPAARIDVVVEHAHPYRLSASELRTAVERIDAWCAAPTW